MLIAEYLGGIMDLTGARQYLVARTMLTAVALQLVLLHD